MIYHEQTTSPRIKTLDRDANTDTETKETLCVTRDDQGPYVRVSRSNNNSSWNGSCDVTISIIRIKITRVCQLTDPAGHSSKSKKAVCQVTTGDGHVESR